MSTDMLRRLINCRFIIIIIIIIISLFRRRASTVTGNTVIEPN